MTIHASPTKLTAVELGVQDDGSPLLLTLVKMLAARLLVTAVSGGGKSYAIRKLLEETEGFIGPQIVIDPEGEFYTLRDQFNHLLVGRPAGRDGDIPATVKSAPMLARELMATGASAVIDLSEMDEDEQRDYVREFCAALIAMPRELWRSALVVIDEAQVFLPEGAKDDVATAVRNVMTRGRKRGLATILGTQRVSAIDKTAVAMCANVLVGQTTLDIDIDRAAKSLGMKPAAARSILADLEPGEFFVRGPALTKLVTKCKIGQVSTRHPEPGQAPLPPPAPAAMNALIAKFAALPAAADAEAKTVDELRARVRELEAQLQAKPAATAIPVAADPAAIDRAVGEANARAREHFEAQAQALLRAVENEAIRAAGAAISGVFTTARSVPVTDLPPPRATPASPARAAEPKVPAPTRRAPSPPAPVPALPSRSRVPGVTGPEQRIIDSLAWWERIGVAAPGLPALAFRSNYSPKSSGFLKARSLCQSRGLITCGPDKRTILTEAGRATANPLEGDFKTQVLGLLAGPESRLLAALIASRDGLDDTTLAELGGYSPNSSGYLKARGHLCSLGLAVRRQPGWTEPAPFLFADT